MRAIVALMVVAAALAGCSSEDAPDTAPEEPGVQFEDPERNLTIDQPTLPVDPPAPGERTLNETPTWRLGEWWEYEITSYFDGKRERVERVVAGTERGNYLVGFPIDSFSNFAMVMHHPAYGDIHQDDLGYDTHDAPFSHLKFPLTEGDAWDTTWQNPNNTITMTVEDVDHASGKAVINITQTSTDALGQQQTTDFGRIEYDAELGEAQKMTFNGYAQVEVVDHGYDYQGAVRVPHQHDLVFFHGRLAGAAPIGQSSTGSLFGVAPEPAGPEETIHVEDFYDRVSFAIIIIDVPGFVAQTGMGSGYYEQTATAPDGAEYTLSMTPDEQQALKLAFFEHAEPAGEWHLNTVAGGPGQVLFEGIGYHSIEIELPSGCVLPSTNALHHVTLCEA